MSDIFSSDDDTTPLTPEERRGLIPDYIATRRELDELEQANILKGEAWARRQTREILDIDFSSSLHKAMFGDVWAWAGAFSNESGRHPVGVDGPQIREELIKFVGDAATWAAMDAFADPIEAAAAFHQRCTWIHPFPNGNGRWARIYTDLYTDRYLRLPPIHWGGPDILRDTEGNTRRTYLAALRLADRDDPATLTALLRMWSENV